MKTNTILEWLVLPASTFVLIGCGGGGGGSASGSVATGQAFYVDSAVQGVDYNCGSQVGVTGSKGEFTFEVGQSCTFSLDTIKLRDVAADKLKDGKEIQETNMEIARVLQSLDSDHNPENGIVIDSSYIKKLIDPNMSTVNDIINTVYPGFTVVSAAKAKAHLIRSILSSHTLYTEINGEHGTLQSVSFNADFNSVVMTEIENGGDGSNTTTVHVEFDGTDEITFDSNPIDKYSLVIKKIKEDYCTVVFDSHTTRLYYDEAKARASFLN